MSKLYKILIVVAIALGSFLTIDGIYLKPERDKAKRKFVIIRPN